MQSDEAVESAVKEFELQGYDLSTIIRSATGTDFSKWVTLQDLTPKLCLKDIADLACI